MNETPPVDRSGLTQLFLSNATLIASNAKNNIWMHFNRRLLAYVKRQLEIPKREYDALTKAEIWRCSCCNPTKMSLHGSECLL